MAYFMGGEQVEGHVQPHVTMSRYERHTHQVPDLAIDQIDSLVCGMKDDIPFGQDADRPIPCKDRNATDIVILHKSNRLGN
jgi:hypothetical protein